MKLPHIFIGVANFDPASRMQVPDRNDAENWMTITVAPPPDDVDPSRRDKWIDDMIDEAAEGLRRRLADPARARYFEQ